MLQYLVFFSAVELLTKKIFLGFSSVSLVSPLTLAILNASNKHLDKSGVH